MGPGQAVTIGTVFEKLGYANAVPVGLISAALGFIIAFGVGVPAANWGIRKGIAKNAGKLSDDFLRGVMKKDSQKESAGNLTYHSANVETLAMHVAIIGTVYLCAYYLSIGMTHIFPAKHATLVMGSIYVTGMVVAMIFRVIMNKVSAGHVMCNSLNKRIAGWAVDYMIVATLMAVKVTAMGSFLIPVLFGCLVAGLVTAIISYYFGTRIGGDVDFERTLGLYGMSTGTVNSGLLLIRIVDPDYRSTAPTEIGLMNPITLLALPVYYMSSGVVLFGWTIGKTLMVSAGAALLAIVLLKIFRVWGKPTYSLFSSNTSVTGVNEACASHED